MIENKTIDGIENRKQCKTNILLSVLGLWNTSFWIPFVEKCVEVSGHSLVSSLL